MTALIVYASYTGHTEKIAFNLEKFLKESGIETTIEECTRVNPAEFLKYDICVVATYTFGRDGDLPDEIEDFYVDMGDLDLSGKTFGVLGTGETKYDRYCQSVTDFDEQFEKCGADRGAAPLKIELYTEDEKLEEIKNFAESLIRTSKG